MLFDVLFCRALKEDVAVRRRKPPMLTNAESSWRLVWQQRLDRLEILLARM